MPPIDFCNRYEPPTHLWSSQTSTSVVGKIPHRSSDSTSLAGRADREFSAQGLRSTDTQRPSNATARLDGFTPT